MAEKWNPQEEPWVLGSTWRNNNPQLHYWHTTSKTFASEEEARAAFDAPFRPGEKNRTLRVYNGGKPGRHLTQVARRTRPKKSVKK